MKFRPTPERAAGAYDFLRLMPPFNRLKLPEADELMFRVSGHKDRFGHFKPGEPFHEFVVSDAHVTSLWLLFGTVAHEMIHLHQQLSGQRRGHNAEFERLANSACRNGGFDRKTF